MQCVRDHVLLERLLCLGGEVALGLHHNILPRLLTLHHPRSHLLARCDGIPPLAQLLFARLALLRDEREQLGELGASHVLRVRRVVAHQQQLFIVVLLGMQRRLDCAQLVVKVDALLLEPLDNLVVRLTDRLCLIVFDHCLVEPILECADLAHERVGFVSRPRGGALHVSQLILELPQHLLLGLVAAADLVLLCPQLRERLLDLDELRRVDLTGLGPAALLGQCLQRRAQLLLLLAQPIDGVLILLQRELRLLIEGLAIALQQLKAALEVG
mmetsp:Transcript_7264/g.19015  ORF Transcript_7264/g.19015 Transcript_7264/m.19015 type:complete len:271 (+) Transcript_7264:1106-1918(+)